MIKQSLFLHLRHKWAWYGLNLIDKIILKLLFNVDYREWDKELFVLEEAREK